jgi:hypothetical protein
MTMSQPVLFIIGHGRSGTTLLGNILGELPGAFHGGEMLDLWRRGATEDRCGCGRPIGTCPVWSGVLARMRTPGDGAGEEVRRWQRAVLRLRNVRRLLRTKTAGPPWPMRDVLARTLSGLYRATAEVTGAKVIVDSSKSSTAAALLRWVPGIDPSYVHLVRDPRAVAFSWTRRRDNLRGGQVRREMPTYPAWRSARAWLLWNAVANGVRRRAGHGSALLLRYEDLVDRPREALETVRQRVGGLEGPLPLVEDHTAQLGTNHTIGGNPARFSTGRVELRRDDEWRSEQRPSDRAVITAITLPLLARYGYPVRPGALRDA